MKTLFVFVLALCWPFVGLSQTDQWSEEDWEPLVDEPSRQDLLPLTIPPEFEMEAIPLTFWFPQDTHDRSNGSRLFGIDLNHYSPASTPIASLSAKNIRYVYVKATQGVSLKDAKFGYFWEALGRLPDRQKVARGAYHFLSSDAGADPVLQAERFVAYVNLHGGFTSEDLPPVVDLEWDITHRSDRDRWSYRTPRQIVNATLAFLSRVEVLTGTIPMLYTARAWWRERLIPEKDIAKFARYPLWIADYGNKTRLREKPLGPHGVTPTLWQFSDKARISGARSGVFDANVFSGTEEDFMKTFFQKVPGPVSGHTSP
ncbi:MAG: glycoside hydrolase [Bdellovibrio sp.]|nr:MAG: glycoside hydrolase [Bdellovibrio sp.]